MICDTDDNGTIISFIGQRMLTFGSGRMDINFDPGFCSLWPASSTQVTMSSPVQMALPELSHRMHNAGMSQAHRDITDERYHNLRRPRKVRFYVNGDRYFKGKRMYITPHRYLNFNDLLNDLTGKLPNSVSLPYGVRQIFTPNQGQRILEIEDLQDGEAYVCAGFEGFKGLKYGKAELEPWSVGEYQFSLCNVGLSLCRGFCSSHIANMICYPFLNNPIKIRS